MTNVHWGFNFDPPEVPVVVGGCTEQERAVIDAARAYVTAMRRWSDIPARELSTRQFQVAWDAANRAWAALDAAIVAAPEEDR